MSLFKDFRVVIPPKRVRHEQTTEEQNFGDQKDPDSQLSRIELLFGRVKVMSDKLTMVVVVIVCGVV